MRQDSSDWELVRPDTESTAGYIGRSVARTGARALESVAGAPADIATTLHNVAKKVLPSYGEAAQKENLPNILPTSENIREYGTKKLTGNYLEPRTQGEENWDQIVSDAALLFSPNLIGKGNALMRGAKAAGKALGISAAGNLAKWGSESLGASPLVGSGVKLGTMVLAGTLGTRKELDSLRNKSYETGLGAIPDKKRFNFSQEKKHFSDRVAKLSRSTIPDKNVVIQKLTELKDIPGKTGAAKVKEIISAKQGLNEFIREEGRRLGPTAKRELNEAVGVLNKGISRYGNTNKAFYEPYLKGEELTAGLKSMDYVGAFINKYPYLKKKMDDPIIGSLFKGGVGYGIYHTAPLKIGAALGGLYGLHETAKAIKLLSKSPVARNAYRSGINNALKENATAFAKDLNKIQEESDRLNQQESDEWEFVKF